MISKPLLVASISVWLLSMDGAAEGITQGLTPARSFNAALTIPLTCQVTQPNGQTPPSQKASPLHHGNGELFTYLWPKGTVVFRPSGAGRVLEDGSLEMKFGWWRTVRGQLKIEGRRLDASAPGLRARIPSGYSGVFQASSLIFPTPGCWEVTGRAGEASLTFVTRVVKIGEGPRGPVPRALTPPNNRLHPTAAV